MVYTTPFWRKGPASLGSWTAVAVDGIASVFSCNQTRIPGGHSSFVRGALKDSSTAEMLLEVLAQWSIDGTLEREVNEA